MADNVSGKKRLSPSVIVAIIGMAAATVLGGVTIWQSSAETQKQTKKWQDRKLEIASRRERIMAEGERDGKRN